MPQPRAPRAVRFRRRGVLVAAPAVALACVASATSAGAQSLPALRIGATAATARAPQTQCCPVEPPALRLDPDRAAALLTTASTTERAARDRDAALALGVGLGTAGAGAAALFSAQPAVHLPAWTGIGVGGMMLTASLAAWLAPTRAAQLEPAVQRARRARDAAAIDALERRWAALAADERAQRLALGAGGTAVALALGAASAATLLAERDPSQSSGDAPRMVAGALLGASAASVLGWSLSSLVQAGPLESSLAAWRRAGGTRAPSRPAWQLAPQVTPGATGAMVIIGGTF